MSWVRVSFGDGPPRCEVAGISNRRPVVRAVGFHTAAALIADGVPAVFRHLSAGGPARPAPDVDALVGGSTDRG